MGQTLLQELEKEAKKPKRGNRGSNYFQRLEAYTDAVERRQWVLKKYPEFSDPLHIQKVLAVKSIFEKYLGTMILDYTYYENPRDNGGKNMFTAMKTNTGTIAYLGQAWKTMKKELEQYGHIEKTIFTGRDKVDVLVHIPINKKGGKNGH